MLDTVREFAAERAADHGDPPRRAPARALLPRFCEHAADVAGQPTGASRSSGSRTSAATSASRTSGCCAPGTPTRRSASPIAFAQALPWDAHAHEVAAGSPTGSPRSATRPRRCAPSALYCDGALAIAQAALRRGGAAAARGAGGGAREPASRTAAAAPIALGRWATLRRPGRGAAAQRRRARGGARRRRAGPGRGRAGRHGRRLRALADWQRPACSRPRRSSSTAPPATPTARPRRSPSSAGTTWSTAACDTPRSSSPRRSSCAAATATTAGWSSR